MKAFLNLLVLLIVLCQIAVPALAGQSGNDGVIVISDPTSQDETVSNNGDYEPYEDDESSYDEHTEEKTAPQPQPEPQEKPKTKTSVQLDLAVVVSGKHIVVAPHVSISKKKGYDCNHDYDCGRCGGDERRTNVDVVIASGGRGRYGYSGYGAARPAYRGEYAPAIRSGHYPARYGYGRYESDYSRPVPAVRCPAQRPPRR